MVVNISRFRRGGVTNHVKCNVVQLLTCEPLYWRRIPNIVVYYLRSYSSGIFNARQRFSMEECLNVVRGLRYYCTIIPSDGVSKSFNIIVAKQFLCKKIIQSFRIFGSCVIFEELIVQEYLMREKWISIDECCQGPKFLLYKLHVPVDSVNH